MPREIERKFLLTDDSWKADVSRAVGMRQGYLNSAPERTVRVRIAGERAYLTVKGPVTGITRPEFEYEIPVAEGLAMMELCEQPVIEKTRFYVDVAPHTWEIDVFSGDNEGLVVAEIELHSEGEDFVREAWLGAEVSGDKRYYNSGLVRKPYLSWP